jgi:hypothetical protein
MSKIGLYYEVILRDRNGKVVKRFKRKSESWLRGFIGILRALMIQRYGTAVSAQNITDETGTARGYPDIYAPSGYVTYYLPCCNGDAGDISQGIVVGSSDTANDINTYALGSKISHGTGSGQLLYNPMTFEDIVNPSGTILQFRLTRVFTNNSGADVTVKEMGLLAKGKDNTDNPRSWLIARDVLTSPITIPDGYSLTLRYIVKITIT